VPGSKREKEKKMKREREREREREGRKESLVVASSAPLRKAHERTKRSKAAAATHARLAHMALLLAFAWPGGRDDDGWMDGRMVMMDRVDGWMN
jgi:hypothetical protein